MKINKTIRSVVNCFFSLLLIVGLFFQKESYGQMNEKRESFISNVDYGNIDNWAAHPDKIDLSDSNTVLHINSSYIKAHVFFIHPTTYTGKMIEGVWNADLNDTVLNKKTDESSILYQSTAFKNQTIIFAPRYRQAHINAFYIDNKEADNYFEIAYQDVKNAFQYYLSFLNDNKPIIIASHSQGTKHAGRLLKEFFEDKELKNKLVCAYIIGMPIPSNYFSNLKPCENKDETGCFVGWRTYKRNYIPEEVMNEKFTSIVINPLSWTSEPIKIDKKENEGGILSNYKKLVPKVVDAEIHGNILWSCKPDVPGKIFFTKKNFHIGDINLFYASIYKNVGNRISNFLKRKEN